MYGTIFLKGKRDMKKITAFLLSAVLLFAGCSSSASSTPASVTASATDAGMTITVFNAGKADAMLFQTADGYVLMDTGLDENKDALVAQLKQMGVTSLYALIITHFDKDHVGGADAVIDAFDTKNVYTTYVTSNNADTADFEASLEKKNLEMTIVSNTDFSLGSISFDINGAKGGYDTKKDNNSSLITMVTYGTKKYLFMGDAEDERIEEYLADHDANADFLKVPYHGYTQDDLELLFQTVAPETAVITNSSDNPSASQIKKTEKLLKAAGSNYYEAAKGDITVSCTETGFTVSQ
jgi:beta-lactamase superfamily II metal-dependent hydrolase